MSLFLKVFVSFSLMSRASCILNFLRVLGFGFQYTIIIIEKLVKQHF